MSYIKIGIMKSGDGVEIFKFISGEDYPYLGIAEEEDGVMPTRWDKNGKNEFNHHFDFKPKDLISIDDLVIGNGEDMEFPVIGEFIKEDKEGFHLIDYSGRKVIVDMIAKYKDPKYGILKSFQEDEEDASSIGEYLDMVESIVDIFGKSESGKK